MRSEGYSSRSVCLCVLVCVCVYYYSRTTGYEAAYERYQQLQCYKGKKANMHNEHWLTGIPRPRLARSAHRGRMKLLRGYVSKSIAVLNRLTITQLASL